MRARPCHLYFFLAPRAFVWRFVWRFPTPPVSLKYPRAFVVSVGVANPLAPLPSVPAAHRDTLDKLYTDACIKDKRPLTHGDNDNWRGFFNYITNNSWRPPSAHRKRRHLHERYGHTLAALRKVLLEHGDYVFIMVDGWSTRLLRGYTGIIASFITKAPSLTPMNLVIGLPFLSKREGKLTAERIASAIATTLATVLAPAQQ